MACSLPCPRAPADCAGPHTLQGQGVLRGKPVPPPGYDDPTPTGIASSPGIPDPGGESDTAKRLELPFTARARLFDDSTSPNVRRLRAAYRHHRDSQPEFPCRVTPAGMMCRLGIASGRLRAVNRCRA